MNARVTRTRAATGEVDAQVGAFPSVPVGLRALMQVGRGAGGHRVVGGNRLTPVGVCAVGGIYRTGPIGQGRQLPSRVSESTDVFVQRL